jgi:hypothetical protein
MAGAREGLHLMARLYRPHIPLSVRVDVASRQLRQFGELLEPVGKATLRDTLDCSLSLLAGHLGCAVADLRLDHDPPLGARPKIVDPDGTMIYSPDANDPLYLAYRPHGTEFAGSHDVKTRIRGDHGQFSDIALIKRQRRRERGPKPKRSGFCNKPAKKASILALTKKKWPSRPFPKRNKK